MLVQGPEMRMAWIGLRAVETLVHFHDIHIIILHQLGLGQNPLIYLRLGCEES